MDGSQMGKLISEILQEYRFRLAEGCDPPTFGEFAAALSEPLEHVHRTFTPLEVFNWEAGRCLPPDNDLSLIIYQSRPNTWQWRLARDLRAAKRPDLYRASSRFARKLLGQPRRPGPHRHLPPPPPAWGPRGSRSGDR